jgi:S-adenosylmethionine:tRNA ribosyltransferase-isomerase
MVRPGKKFKVGNTVSLIDDVTATVISIDDDGLRTLKLSQPIDDPIIEAHKETPFPPYISPDEKMAKEYQTVYANDPGSKAAPTAGLHFTKELLERISQDHPVVKITLEVGLGTFASLKPEQIESGRLHEERYAISAQSAVTLNRASSITAVGTTTVRTLESYRSTHDRFSAAHETTDIFIKPGYAFAAVDHLITNFHLPGTSLLYLVAAFVGSENELARIYQHAITNSYRFYSFGDAMLII